MRLDVLLNVGQMLLDRGRVDEAAETLRSAREDFGRALGPDHTSTRAAAEAFERAQGELGE